MLLNNKKGILSKIKEKSIGLESTIQKNVEENLSELFNLEFVETEFQLNSLRIDTLAYDIENNSFVIIEYKKGRNESVIDQGYSYLSLLLNNKADFILKINEKLDKNISKTEDIDWSSTKVMFVSPQFTKYQVESTGFRDMPIELWEFKLYENDIVSLNQISVSDKNESIKTIEKNSKINKVTNEIKSYTINDHFKDGWENSKSLLEELTNRVELIDSKIEVKANKQYIAFYIDKKILVAILPRKSKLVLELFRVEPKDLNDPYKKTRYKKDSLKFYNKHIAQMDIENEDDIEYSIPLIKQIYKKFFL